MTNRIKDLTLNDVHKYWYKLCSINIAFIFMFTDNEESFNYFKSTLPEDIGNMKIEMDNEYLDKQLTFFRSEKI